MVKVIKLYPTLSHFLFAGVYYVRLLSQRTRPWGRVEVMKRLARLMFFIVAYLWECLPKLF
jgi:hypothetical protein